jgi:uncharacterized membrane protein
MATIRRSVLLDVPCDAVFEVLRQPANYPRFMPEFRSVVDEGDGSWRWTYEGATPSQAFSARIAGIEESVIRWVSDDGPWQSLQMSCSPLAGPSTWLVCIAEIEVPDADAVTQVEALSRTMREWILAFQSAMERGLLGGPPRGESVTNGGSDAGR